MSAPRCVVLGAGRMAGGFIAPSLAKAGWEVVLVGRTPRVISAINEAGGVWLRLAGRCPPDCWIGGVRAVLLTDPALPWLVLEADLVATAVGASGLHAVGRLLGPALGTRTERGVRPLNILTFENHRRAPELLALGLIAGCPPLAQRLGATLGIAGAAVWRTICSRTECSEGVRFEADALDESYLDANSLVSGAAPLDGSLPALELVHCFERRIVEKLWLFNAGHAAAAYLGWQAGHPTIAEAMADKRIGPGVEAVVAEARAGFEAYLGNRPWAAPVPPRPLESILARYADQALDDPVRRVAREPRRKLGLDDRLIGPALACLGAGKPPFALADACAAALAYAEPTEPQALDLQRELALLGPEEVLAAVSGLDRRDELPRLIGAAWRARSARRVAA